MGDGEPEEEVEEEEWNDLNLTATVGWVDTNRWEESGEAFVNVLPVDDEQHVEKEEHDEVAIEGIGFELRLSELAFVTLYFNILLRRSVYTFFC